MHRVCVCVIHQNVKLMLNSLTCKINYKELLEKLACNIEKRNCMLSNCNDCPSVDIISEYLINLFKEFDYEDDNIIKYREWIQTDRSELYTNNIEFLEFIDKLIKKLTDIKSHYFITKSQFVYLKSIKENLAIDSVIILLDYSENYSFIYQDAIQSIH